MSKPYRPGKPGLDPAKAKAAQQAQFEARRAQGLPARKNPLERLAAKPTSLRQAITAHCYQCMGEMAGWQKEVQECTAPQCALFNLRPGREKATDPDDYQEEEEET